MDGILIGISILLLLFATYLSLHLIRITHQIIIWLVLAIALALMIFRRMITLSRVMDGSSIHFDDTLIGVIVVIISLALVFALLNIKKLFYRIQQAQKELKEKNVELDEVNKRLKQFTAIASHDLKAPLQTVLSYTEVLKAENSKVLDEKSLNYLFVIEKSVKRMAKLISGLLNFAKLGTEALKNEAIELNEILNEVTLDLQARLKETNGRIEAENLPKIYGDKLQIRQLFQNLISNALKFHKKEEAPCVKIQKGISNNSIVEIIITDNGIGIEKQNLEAIFEPFKKLHGRSEYEGSGLGLAICKKIVERHKGEISIQSELNFGTTFKILLPVR